MTNYYQKLQQRIREIEGITAEDELGFGCEVKLLGADGKCFQTTIFRSNKYFVDLETTSILDKDLSTGTRHSKQELTTSRLFEILGKPLTLERVLMALGKFATCRINEDGSCFIFKANNASGKNFASINLQKPLSEQEKTCEKLYNLIK